MSWSRAQVQRIRNARGTLNHAALLRLAQIRYEYESRRTMHSFSYSMSVPASQQGSQLKKGSRRWKPKKETIAPAASNACLYHHSKLDHIRCSQKSSWTASGPRSLGTTVKNCTGAMRYPRLKEIKDQHGLLGVGYPYMIYNIVSWLAPMGSKPFGFGHLQFVWGILARSCSIIYIYIILYNYT